MFYLKEPIAHRGLHSKDCAENSLQSFKNAIAQNFAIELDVQLSRDGVAFVFHDENLFRMTGIDKDIKDVDSGSLSKMILSDKKSHIPSLQEVLKLVKGKVPLIIEIKCKNHTGEIEAAVMKDLEDYTGEYTIQSFNPFTLKWFRQRYAYLRLGLLVTGKFENIKLKIYERILLRYMLMIPFVRPDYIGLNYDNFSLSQYFIIRKLTNASIIFWTIRDEQTYKECLEFCENVIFENFNPRKLSEA